MFIKEAVEHFRQHQKGNVRKNTIRSYGKFLEPLHARFSKEPMDSVSPDDISTFLDECTEGLEQIHSPSQVRSDENVF